jgi:sortase A
MAWGAGLVLLASYAATRIEEAIAASRDLERFADARLATSAPVDTTLWSEGRKRAYEASLAQGQVAPLAVLRIPGVDLEVAVHEGVDDAALDRGVGRIPGTARPGETGNIGIAGHRDGFFRVLSDVSRGETIELETLDRVDTYVVLGTEIVEPTDVSVLAPSAEPTLTLVTCYPFYFVGSAPQRFIVRATRREPAELAELRDGATAIQGHRDARDASDIPDRTTGGEQ